MNPYILVHYCVTLRHVHGMTDSDRACTTCKAMLLAMCICGAFQIVSRLLREQTTGESCPHAKTSLSGMTRGRTRLYLSLDKLERTSWSYTAHMLCASIVPLDALMVGKVRLVGDADARSML